MSEISDNDLIIFYFLKVILMVSNKKAIEDTRDFLEATKERRYADVNNGMKSCWNCRNSSKDPGYGASFYDPGEPPMTECMILLFGNYPSEILKVIMDFEEAYGHGKDFEEDANDCPFYEPLLVERCDYCGKPSDLPLTEAPTDCLMERMFYCSTTCQDASKKNFEEFCQDQVI
jgi:hypothetical protein